MNLPKSKYNLGYTKKEVHAICRRLKVPTKKFWKKFGINTCGYEDGHVLYYRYDIEVALLCCLQNRDKTFVEWD